MSQRQQDKAARFRTLHESGIFVIPNPWDVGSARILAALGFPALATTSAGFAFSIGRRDGQVSRDEKLAHCREIVAATDLPVSADLERCFGDAPEIVAETIRLAAGTGLVGGSVEDATGNADAPIYDFSLAVERVASAVEAARAQTVPFTLTARCENFIRGRRDLDDTIKRLTAYAEAGADVLYAPALPDLSAIRVVCQAVAPKPVNVMCGAGSPPLAALSEAGVRRASVGAALSLVAYGAFVDAARSIQESGTFDGCKGAPFPEINGFMGMLT